MGKVSEEEMYSALATARNTFTHLLDGFYDLKEENVIKTYNTLVEITDKMGYNK